MFHGSLLDAQNAGVMGRTLNLHRFYGMHKQKTNITINVFIAFKRCSEITEYKPNRISF